MGDTCRDIETLMDLWRLGIVSKPLPEIVAEGFGTAPIHWIESRRRFTFLADPFGMWREDYLFVFAEAYDYRSRHGHIEVLKFDRALRLLDRRPCLREHWHLSYPFVFEDDGEIWMLPEAHRSGELNLYRSVKFPYVWRREFAFDLAELAVDATPFRHQGLWWLFYSPAGGVGEGRLHAAYSEKLNGRWIPHPDNPLTTGLQASRPGGTPLVRGNFILLPVQDASRGYGSGMRLLGLDQLSPQCVTVGTAHPLEGPSGRGRFDAGFHTLAAAGDVTLIDVKRLEKSAARLPIDLFGRVRRAVR